MDKEKLIETVTKSLEKQYGVEMMQRDILQLQMYLNTIECKISQYNMEAEKAKADFAKAEISADAIWKKVFGDAEDAYNLEKEKLQMSRDDIEEAAKKDAELNVKTNQDLESLSKEKEALIEQRTKEQQEKIDEINAQIEVESAKKYLFRAKEKEKVLEGLKQELETAIKGMAEIVEQAELIRRKISEDREEEAKRYEKNCGVIKTELKDLDEYDELYDDLYLEESENVESIDDGKGIDKNYTFFNEDSIELAVLADANAQVAETEYFVVLDKLATATMEFEETQDRIMKLQQALDLKNAEIKKTAEDFANNTEMATDAAKGMIEEISGKAKEAFETLKGNFEACRSFDEEEIDEQKEEMEGKQQPTDFTSFFGGTTEDNKKTDVKDVMKKAAVKNAKKLLKSLRDLDNKK